MILNEKGEKFKTRDGKSYKLEDLLNEAKNRAKLELKNRIEA